MTTTTASYINSDHEDDIYTNALIALERHEYERAKTYARIILNRSEWIERRLAALTVLNLAAHHDDVTTDKTLDIAYDNDTRAKKYRF